MITSQELKTTWPHKGSVRERIRRWELSSVVQFGPQDEVLRRMTDLLAEKALKKVDEIAITPKQAVRLVIEEVRTQQTSHKLLATLCRAFDPTIWFGRHRLVEAFHPGTIPACYDVSLLIHFVLERMGQKGSHVVGFLAPDSHLPSFGVEHEGEVFLYEKDDWVSIESFRRLLRSEGMSERLHTMYPPLSVSELLQEWIDKARGCLRRTRS